MVHTISNTEVSILLNSDILYTCLQKAYCQQLVQTSLCCSIDPTELLLNQIQDRFSRIRKSLKSSGYAKVVIEVGWS